MMYVDAAGSKYDYQDLFIRMVFQENHFLVECAYLVATTTGLAQELHRLQITAAAKPIIFFHLGTLLKKEM